MAAQGMRLGQVNAQGLGWQEAAADLAHRGVEQCGSEARQRPWGNARCRRRLRPAPQPSTADDRAPQHRLPPPETTRRASWCMVAGRTRPPGCTDLPIHSVSRHDHSTENRRRGRRRDVGCLGRRPRNAPGAPSQGRAHRDGDAPDSPCDWIVELICWIRRPMHGDGRQVGMHVPRSVGHSSDLARESGS